MNLEKLKDTARKFEQKEDWRRAIEVYLKAIQQIESGQETSPDLSLYNRVGDLYLKTNDTSAAVRSYERAVDLYADQGFFNNAIALCGKILRVNPGRTQTYLKLAQLHARKNVVIEAKRNLIEFLERMNALGQLDQAFQSVKEFADQFFGSQEIRLMLVELLRAASREDEAREQLEKLAGEIEGRDLTAGPRRSQERLRTSAVEEPSPVPRPTPRSSGLGGLVFLDTGVDVPTSPPVVHPDEGAPAEPPVAVPDGLLLNEPLPTDTTAEPPSLPGLERTAEVDFEMPAGAAHLGDGLGIDRVESADLEFVGEPLEGMEEPLGLVDGPDLPEAPEEELLVSLDDAPPLEATGEEALEVALDEPPPEAPAAATSGLPLIPVEAGDQVVSDLESLILEDPDDPVLHARLGERLMVDGDHARGLEELELALSGYEGREEWAGAARVAERLVALSPDAIRYHQKRVELAFRSGERSPLLAAYLALGDALARAGAREKAVAVYGRVQEHDPDNAHAAAALAALSGAPAEPFAPPPPPPPPPARAAPAPAAPAPVAAAPPPPTPAPPPRVDGFVDLGSMILEEPPQRDTRMRIDRREPRDEDEQREFQEILEQFKRGIEENLDTEDYQAHYDLGVAFKEMGLLDEAIAEFQKALRSPEGRLRTSEALGLCFFEKGQFAISETVLRRAVDTGEGGDEAKVGLLYWLGRAAEAQGKASDAQVSYERALAVDIRFMDLSERMHRLTAGRQR